MECEVQGIPIYYETIGEGRPLLMLHGGYIDHHHMIDDLEPIFAKHPHWQRIYPDLPGHGRTPAPDWLVSHDQVLDIILGFVEAVIPNKRFAVAGVSRGGYLARGLMAKRPKVIAGGLLVVPAKYAIAPAASLPDKVVLAKDEAAWAKLQPSEISFFDGYVVQDQKALEAMRKTLPTAAAADVAYQERILRNYEFSFDVDREPTTFDAPILIVAGKHDTQVGYVDTFKMLAQYPRATLAILDRAGHYLGTEQSGLLHALGDEWLKRVEEMGE